MTDVQLAVWGLGTHAIKNILPAVRLSRGLKLVGVCSRNATVVAEVAEQFGCKRWTSPTEMLRDPDVDVVYLATPIALHAAQGEMVLSAGKHFWCEKPIAASLEQAESLLELSRARSVTIAEGFMYLYHPQFTYLQRLVSSGTLGRIHTVSCRFGIPALKHPGFRVDPALGGGAFLDVGSYPISATASLITGSDPEVLMAEIVVMRGSPVDTAGRAVLRYENDVRVVLEWANDCAYRNEIDLWGTSGSVSTERVFSKSADYRPQFRCLDVRGAESYQAGVAANHFVMMLESFGALIDDPVRAECEREAIVHRVRLSDAIRNKSTRRES